MMKRRSQRRQLHTGVWNGRWIATICGAGGLLGCVLDLGDPHLRLDAGDEPTETDEPFTETPAPTSSSEPTETEEPTETDEPTELTEEPQSDTEPLPEGGLSETEAGCRSGFETCEDECVPTGTCLPPPPPCEEVCQIPNALSECIDEVCTFVACEPAWVDCDMDADEYDPFDPSASNGCESEFGDPDAALPEGPFGIVKKTIREPRDWVGISVHAIATPCMDCGQRHSDVPEQVALYERQAADPSDLRAGFSMAWDPSGIWLRTMIWDDEWIEGLAPPGGGGPKPSIYDHVEFVFDGDNPSRFGEPSDHHLFIGVDGNVFDQQVPVNMLVQRVSATVENVGACRILTAKLSDGYLEPNLNQFIRAGQIYGFAISLNDFDRRDGDERLIERQHHLFYRDPGQNYVYGPRNLPQITPLE